MFSRNTCVVVIVCILGANCSANAAIQVVASLPDIGSIASYIGGDQVGVSSIARANSNPHSIEVFPSFMAKVSKAAIYLKCGLGLDQWADAIIDGSRNNRLTVVDCSVDIAVLEKPTGKVDASLGDVHPFGNPHYWLDPDNGIIIAQNIVAALQKVDPSHSSLYAANLEKFKGDSQTRIAVWREQMKPFVGANIITYHSSWVYFAAAFGLKIIASVEPFPGIPPSGKHLAYLIDLIKTDRAAFIIQEPYFPDDAPQFLNRQTGIPVLKLPPACNGVGPNDYFDHFDVCIKSILTQVRR